MSRKNTKGTILAIDMGNTNIVIGCVDDDKVIFEERLSTDLSKTELEYAISFKNVLEIYNIKSEDINGANYIVSCSTACLMLLKLLLKRL